MSFYFDKCVVFEQKYRQILEVTFHYNCSIYVWEFMSFECYIFKN